MSADAMIVRVARKRHRCANAHAAEVGNPLVANICKRYVEGELNETAGGFGHDRICEPCAQAGQA